MMKGMSTGDTMMKIKEPLEVRPSVVYPFQESAEAKAGVWSIAVFKLRAGDLHSVDILGDFYHNIRTRSKSSMLISGLGKRLPTKN